MGSSPFMESACSHLSRCARAGTSGVTSVASGLTLHHLRRDAFGGTLGGEFAAAPQRARHRAYPLQLVGHTRWGPPSVPNARAVRPGSPRWLRSCNKLETRFFGHIFDAFGLYTRLLAGSGGASNSRFAPQALSAAGADKHPLPPPKAAWVCVCSLLKAPHTILALKHSPMWTRRPTQAHVCTMNGVGRHPGMVRTQQPDDSQTQEGHRT